MLDFCGCTPNVVTLPPARKHAAKVFEQLLRRYPGFMGEGKKLPVIYHVGQRTTCRDDTDRELPFHQEANFMYLTGASEVRGASVVVSLKSTFNASCQDSISVAENDVETVLFVPPSDPLEVMWCGLPPSLQQIKHKLSDLTEVKYCTDLDSYLESKTRSGLILTLPSTSHARAQSDPKLLEAIHEARTIKTAEELEIMAHANQISSEAHESVMKALNTNKVKSELEAESVFLSACRSHGSKIQAYEPIFAYRHHAGTLHYVSNNSTFSEGLSSVLLVDAGCEVLGYASDITRTLPVANGGKFTPQARAIYSIVLEMQNAAIQKIKPGIEWEDIQTLMHKVAARGLLELGILCNATVDECYEEALIMPFFPHGVGHFLGLDTHDVAGLPTGKGKHPTLKYLRLQRKLQVGNVVTVEPGLYFNPFLLDPVKGSEYIDENVLVDYLSVGGIRIEDNVVVTESGCRNLTDAVKSIEAVEKLCGSQLRPSDHEGAL